MDKFDLVIDMIEHPESYSSEELDALFRDPEMRKTYELHCRLSAAGHFGKSLDERNVEHEWQEFKRARRRKPVILSWFGGRAASVAAVVTVSIMAIAAIGVGLRHSAFDENSETDISVNEIDEIAVERAYESMQPDDTAKINVSSLGDASSVTFENEPLENILSEITSANGVNLVFNTPDVRRLRLYFVWEKSLPVDEIVAQLNNFEQINITFDGKTIEVK